MPFITEELYQRLPLSPSDAVSICVADYPEQDVFGSFADDELDKAIAIMQSVVGRIRQMRTDYNLARSTKPSIFIRCTDEDSSKRLQRLADYVQTLGSCSSVSINGSESTEGCALGPISATCQVFMMLRGMIDVDRELSRLNKRIGELTVVCKKLDDEEKSENYAKLPESVREKNAEKLQQSKIELKNLEDAVVSVSSMRA